MLSEFNGSLTWDDVFYKLTIPQLFIMQFDKPSIDYSHQESKDISSADDFLNLIKK